jgi:hypothetical protein
LIDKNEKDEFFESNMSLRSNQAEVSAYSTKSDSNQVQQLETKEIGQDKDLEEHAKLPTSSKANLFESIFDKDEDDFDDLFKKKGSNRKYLFNKNLFLNKFELLNYFKAKTITKSSFIVDDIFGDVDDKIFTNKKNKKEKSQQESKTAISQPKSEFL